MRCGEQAYLSETVTLTSPAPRSRKERGAPTAPHCGFAPLAAARVHCQVHRLHPNTQLMHNVQLRVLSLPQRRVMAAPHPVVLTLDDVYRIGPFIARDAIASEVIEPEVASLQVCHL